MRQLILTTLAFCLILLNVPAWACGGGFGQEVTIDPSQKIVVTYQAGEETYVFKPHFCGAAADFGLILPVPNPLTKNPVLGDSNLVAELESLAAPKVETVEVCSSGGLLGGSSKSDNGSGSSQVTGSVDGVNVISQGQVGEFQWQLLKADSAQNFTDWLDANHFPYLAAAQAAFDHYVQGGWYFVAFSVKAGDAAPPAGYRLCGDFGPIQLSFTTSSPVVPARIAAAGATQSAFLWRIFAMTGYELTASTLSTSASVIQSLRFAGALGAGDLASQPSVAKLGKAGDWFTELDLTFYPTNLTQDIWLDRAPANDPYRQTVYVEKEVDCGVFGCSVTQSLGRPHRLAPAVLLLIGVSLAGMVRRRAGERVASKHAGRH